MINCPDMSTCLTFSDEEDADLENEDEDKDLLDEFDEGDFIYRYKLNIG